MHSREGALQTCSSDAPVHLLPHFPAASSMPSELDTFMHGRRSISREAEGGSGTPREPLLGHTMSAAQHISSQQTGSMAAGSYGALLPRRLGRRSSFREDATGQSPRGRSYRPMAGTDLVGADTVLQVEEAGPPSIADSQVRAATTHSIKATRHRACRQPWI